jgi:hypothetical protein
MRMLPVCGRRHRNADDHAMLLPIARRLPTIRRHRGAPQRSAGGATRQDERNDGGEHRDDGGSILLQRPEPPWTAFRGDHGSIRPQFVSDAGMTAGRRHKPLTFGGRHRRQIVNVKLAVAAETLPGIAGQLLPLPGTRLGDLQRRELVHRRLPPRLPPVAPIGDHLSVESGRKRRTHIASRQATLLPAVRSSHPRTVHSDSAGHHEYRGTPGRAQFRPDRLRQPLRLGKLFRILGPTSSTTPSISMSKSTRRLIRSSAHTRETQN